MKVGGDSESEADQGHEGSHGMHDENGRQGMARCGGQREVGRGLVAEQLLCGNC